MKFVWVMCIASVFVSCEEDFIIDRGTFVPKVTVNALFKPDQDWKVYLTYSRDILDHNSKIKPILDAQVLVVDIHTGRELFLSHKGDGLYSTSYYLPMLNRQYKLIVEVPGYKEQITAYSKVPSQADIINIFKEEVNANITRVNFEIRDNTNNYYIWNLVDGRFLDEGDTITSGNASDYIKGYVKLRNLSSINNPTGIEQDNSSTSAGAFSTNIENETIYNPNEDTITSKPDEIRKYLRIMTASQELYKYFKDVEKFKTHSHSHASFVPTIPVYSNIKNGLGIFAGFTEEYKEID